MALNAKKLKGLAERSNGGKPKMKFGKKGNPNGDEDDEEKVKALVEHEKKEHGGKIPSPEEEEAEHEEEGNPGDEDEGSDEELAARAAAQIAAGKGDEKLMEMMDGYDPETDGNPPEWVADEDIWDRAKEAVDPEGEGAGKYDEPWAVVAHVYDRMGGGRK